MGKGQGSRPALNSGPLDPAQIKALITRIPHIIPYQRPVRGIDTNRLLDRLYDLLEAASDERYTKLLEQADNYQQLSDTEFATLKTELANAASRFERLTEPLCAEIGSFTDIPRAFNIETSKLPKKVVVRKKNAAHAVRATAAATLASKASTYGPRGTLVQLLDGTITIPTGFPLAQIPFCNKQGEALFPHFETMVTPLTNTPARAYWGEWTTIETSTGSQIYAWPTWQTEPVKAVKLNTVGQLRAHVNKGDHFYLDAKASKVKIPVHTSKGKGALWRELAKVEIELSELAVRIVAFSSATSSNAKTQP